MRETQPTLAPGIARMLFPEAQIARIVAELAARIAADYRGGELTLVGVLKGAVFFVTDLARALARIEDGALDVRLDFLAVSSYGNATRSSGEVRLVADTTHSVEGRHVLIVEDIVDNGLTLAYLRGMLAGRGPASLAAAVLLDKPYRRRVDVPVEYVGVRCPDEFVVGYGLDHAERFRALPYVGVAAEE